MKKLLFALIISPLFTFGQKNGVHFLENTSWSAVLQKAKTEHKYIFVDCYASWCAPCKWMDKNVYINDTVGAYINDRFISVRIQMDSTKKDPQNVKDWYATVNQFAKLYTINAYPTFLFFSPEGQAVHKETGARHKNEFIETAQAATDPQKQYYVLLSEYQQGHKDYEKMPYLASIGRQFRDNLSNVIASDYIQHYLCPLVESKIWTKDHIQFIAEYSSLIHYNDRIFHRYMHDKVAIDSVMGSSHYADRLINLIAYEEEVKPKVDAGIKDSTEPHWTKIGKVVERKYGHEYADKNVVKGRVEYYHARQEWANYATYFVEEMKILGIQDWPAGAVTVLNDDAFEVFKYSNDKKELEEALSWIDKAIAMEPKPNAAEIDTKANILYKIGRKEEGIALEQEANQLDPKDKEIEMAYNKMKNGQPTWQ